ncbi:aspartyl protease family protein [Gluconacetobacter sacchari]
MLENIKNVENMEVFFEKKDEKIKIFYDKFSPYVPYVLIEVSGSRKRAEIDTGTLLTVIPEAIAEKIKVRKIGNIENFSTVSGISVKGYLGIIDFIKFSGVTFRNVPVAVMKSDKIILGNMVLSGLKEVIIDKNYMEYGKDSFECRNKIILSSKLGGYERNILYDIFVNGVMQRAVIDTGMSATTLVHYKNKFSNAEERVSSETVASGVFGTEYLKFYKTNSVVDYRTFKVNNEDTMIIMQDNHVFSSVISAKILDKSSIYMNFLSGNVCLFQK